jgi:hypothetical protein
VYAGLRQYWESVRAAVFPSFAAQAEPAIRPYP